MPKDPPRNQPNYKIGGGHLNEFEFQQQKGSLTEEEKDRFARQEEERRVREDETDATPQTEAKRVSQLMERAREKASRRKAKRAKQSVSGRAKGMNNFVPKLLLTALIGFLLALFLPGWSRQRSGQ